MCSILGYYNTPLSYKEIKNYNKLLSHRGPDNSDLKEYKFRDKKLYLGHNRLSIQDLSSNANQPMENEKFVIVFNGEIYNHLEIRKELKRDFKTHSDTETLLFAFSEFGIKNTINKLNGMFAIALFDKKNQKLYLIRDRVGIKPLFWSFRGGEFVFASELKAFKDKKIDENSKIKFLVLGYTPNDKTYYKDIYKLKPAHILEFDGKNIKIKKYWDLPERKIDISFNEAVEEVEYLLKDSIKKRLLSDVEVGSFLSGGVDSSVVTAIMSKISTKQIKTFSIGFNQKEYNEASFAKNIANYLNTNHNEYYFDIQDLINLIDKIVDIYDEPFGDASALPTLILSEFTKKEVSVALSGDGGDELFLGYDRYFFTDNYYYKFKKLPFKNILSEIFKLFPNDKLNKLSYPLKHLTKENLYAVINTALKPWEIREILDKENSTFLELAEYKGEFESIEDFSRYDFYRYIPDDILTKVDRASMKYALEVRVPILDHRIVEFAYSLPQNIKLTKGAKSILKEIVYKYIPKELIDRPKKGFGVPLKIWFRNELKNRIFEKIKNNKELKRRFFLHQKGYNYEYLFWNWYLKGNM
jgi:asparagine synthase (glutamine-hydrolysing)